MRFFLLLISIILAFIGISALLFYIWSLHNDISTQADRADKAEQLAQKESDRNYSLQMAIDERDSLLLSCNPHSVNCSNLPFETKQLNECLVKMQDAEDSKESTVAWWSDKYNDVQDECAKDKENLREACGEEKESLRHDLEQCQSQVCCNCPDDTKQGGSVGPALPYWAPY